MVSSLEEYERLEVPKIPFHAIYGSPLLGDDLIEQFEVYRRKRCDSQTNTNTTNTKDDHPILLMNVTIGRILTGHEGIVHGGIITLLFDEAMAWGCEVIREDPSIPAVTANLNVNFRHPIKAGTPCRIWVYCKSIKGRKMQLEARMESRLDGSSNNTTTPRTTTVYADATSVLITISSHL
jgi:acyl-coenzyme A thioesterase PaaI-like protein